MTDTATTSGNLGSGNFGSEFDPGASGGGFVDTVSSSRGGSSRWRSGLLIGTLLLLIGAGGGSWAVWHYLQPGAEAANAVPAGAVAPAIPAVATRPATAGAATGPAGAATANPAQIYPGMTQGEAGAVAARVAMLEERLARISLAADSASGNAAKAEALLLAFAARRAVERGVPLGLLEAQLRMRFGDSQPNAVESVILASRSPVSMRDLAAELNSLRGSLDYPADASLLDRIRSGVDSLIVVRASGTDSPRAEARFERAQDALMRGRYDLAIAEVEAMPGASRPEVRAWLTRARLRNDAYRALDLIESAAIMTAASAPPARTP